MFSWKAKLDEIHPPNSGEKLVSLLDSEFFGLIAMMAGSAV